VLPLCAALKAATGARLVYDAHELESEANGLSPARRRLARGVERALIHRADYCLFVGQAILEWYRSAYRPARAAVLYNCPNLTRPAPSDRFRQRFAIPPQVPVFLYQGFLGEGRGLRATIEAFAGLSRRAALVVMGYGPLEGLVAEAARRHANVHLHGAVAPGELLAHTAAADFGLSVIEPTSLSYDYCMPNKLFEYVMAMKPVLVSPTVEQRQFVRRRGIGAVAPDTTARGVRQGVLELLSMDRARLDAALAATRETYCWERQEVALQRIYTEALGFLPRGPSPLAAQEGAS
jgi:glycosyltransferase involved in cell wall biosynthesis